MKGQGLEDTGGSNGPVVGAPLTPVSPVRVQASSPFRVAEMPAMFQVAEGVPGNSGSGECQNDHLARQI